MKVALLGGTGFVGKNVSEEFSKQNIEFVKISLANGYDLRKTADNIRFIQESGCDVIVNCAAHVGGLQYFKDHSADILHDNSQMILSLYEGVREVNPNILIIQPIANLVFPANAEIYKEKELWNGALHSSVMPYGITKRLQLAAAQCYSDQFGIRSINLLTPNMFGPHDVTNPDKAHALNALIIRLIAARREGKDSIELWGSGKVIREWLYVKDFARLITLLASSYENFIRNLTVNIGQNSGLSIKDLVTLIACGTHYEGRITWNTAMPDGTPKKVMDDTAFKLAFPSFSFTSLETGINETIQYYADTIIKQRA